MGRSTSALTVASFTAAVSAMLVVAGLWPLGGFRAVTTHGTSMEPTFHAGDLAVTRQRSDYRVGEVVAYRSPTLNTVVLHRIIRTDGQSFITRGDNNGWDDPDHPTAAQIGGRLVFHTPGPTRLMTRVGAPTLALAIGAMTLIGQLMTNRQSGRRGDRRSRRRRSAVARSSAAPTREVVVALVSVGVAAMVLITAVWLAPTPVPAPPGVTVAPRPERMILDYHGVAPRGATYPTGAVAGGDPVFVRVVRSLTVTATYTGKPATTVAMTAEISHPTGWHRPLSLDGVVATPTPTGGSVRGTVNVSGIAGLLTRFSTETGLPAAGITIAVVPRVADWAPRMEFSFDGVQLQTKPEGLTATRAAPARSAAQAGTPPVPDGPAMLAPLGRLFPGPGARLVTSVALVLLSGLATAVVWLLSRRTGVHGGRLRSDRVLAVSSHVPATDRTVVELPHVMELARLAEQEDLPIFENTGPDGIRYLVDTGTILYQCYVALAPELVTQVSAVPNLPAEVVVRLARELRTPLAAVLGYAELLADSSAEGMSHVQRTMVEAIDRGATTLRHLVDDVTVMAELETRPASQLTELVDVGALIGSVCAPLAGSLAERQIQLTSQLDPTLPKIPGDAEKLSRALDELLANAARAAGPGGQIAVTARHTARELVLTVTETGNGGLVAPSASEGALGLTLAQAIVEYHGGDMDLERAPTGSGATATLRLPAAGR